jgi:hypothetical protein
VMPPWRLPCSDREDGPLHPTVNRRPDRVLLGRDAQAAGRSFALMPRKAVSSLSELSKRHKVKGLDRRLPRRRTCPRRRRGRALPGGLPQARVQHRRDPEWLLTLHIGGLTRRKHAVRKAALKAKPAVQVQLGAGGASTVVALKAEDTRRRSPSGDSTPTPR